MRIARFWKWPGQVAFPSLHFFAAERKKERFVVDFLLWLLPLVLLVVGLVSNSYLGRGLMGGLFVTSYLLGLFIAYKQASRIVAMGADRYEFAFEQDALKSVRLTYVLWLLRTIFFSSALLLLLLLVVRFIGL